MLNEWWSDIPSDAKIQGKVIDTLRETQDPLYGEPLGYGSLSRAKRTNMPLTGEDTMPCSMPVCGIDKDPSKCTYFTRFPLYPQYDANRGSTRFTDYDRDGMLKGTDNDDQIFNPLCPIDMTAGRGKQVKVW